ncbi:hypothetical protein TNCV_2456321 [Trichonephila clavipes]|nr:hypothetical protein TNCV_2456321 [Trichonephila clavipes]
MKRRFPAKSSINRLGSNIRASGRQDPPHYAPIQRQLELNFTGASQKTYPTSVNKLTGEYIKINPASSEDHRKITVHLKSIHERFYVIDPPLPDSKKLSLKASQYPRILRKSGQTWKASYLIERVAQLTKSKTKLQLPIFMVEVKKTPDTPDLRKDLKKCC